MQLELLLFKRWLICQYPNSSTSTHYFSDLALFFSYVQKSLVAITTHDVDEYIKYSLASRLSHSSINRRLCSLRSFYYFLSIINDLPVECPIVPERHFLYKPQRLPRDVSEEQIKLILAHIHDLRDKAIFTLMLECGLRVGEIHNLSLDDVLIDNLPRLRIHGKGDQHRIAYLSPPARDTLINWLKSRPVTMDRAVFISRHSKRLSISGIQFILNGYARKADIHLTCHQFRHAFGRRMAEAKLPVTTIQRLLGHRSPRTTQGYINLSNSVLRGEYNEAITCVLESL